MPRYDFVCDACQDHLELPTRKPDEHDSCGGSLRRIWHAPTIAFKGSGFYTTDSR